MVEAKGDSSRILSGHGDKDAMFREFLVWCSRKLRTLFVHSREWCRKLGGRKKALEERGGRGRGRYRYLQ